MLSEACLEFLQAFADSARKIAAEVHLITLLDDRSILSKDIEALLCVSVKVAVDPCDLGNATELLRLTNQINNAWYISDRPIEIA